jgi:hypothetical protein
MKKTLISKKKNNMIVNEIYDEDEPSEMEHIDIFREALLPYMSEDAIVNIEYLGSRYDVDIREGRFAGVSFLGYYHGDYISIELKSKQAFYKLYELFPQANPIDYKTLNENINRFKFLYAFAFGRNLNVKSVHTMDDLMSCYIYDGPNYNHLVAERDQPYSHFSVGMGIGISTLPILLRDNLSYNYSVGQYSHQDKNAIRRKDFEEFEAEFIKRFITAKLGIDKSELTFEHYKILRMLNI